MLYRMQARQLSWRGTEFNRARNSRLFHTYYKEKTHYNAHFTLHNIAIFALSLHDCKCQLSKEGKVLLIPLTETVMKGFT